MRTSPVLRGESEPEKQQNTLISHSDFSRFQSRKIAIRSLVSRHQDAKTQSIGARGSAR